MTTNDAARGDVPPDPWTREKMKAEKQDAIVGRNARLARERLSLTQKDVADRLRRFGWEIDPTAVTRIERGTRSIRVSQLYLLARALETVPTRLMQNEIEEITYEYNRTKDQVRRVATDLRSLVSRVDRLATRLDRDDVVEVLRETKIPIKSARELVPHMVDYAATERETYQVLDRDPAQAEERAQLLRALLARLVQDVVSTSEMAEVMARFKSERLDGGDPEGA